LNPDADIPTEIQPRDFACYILGRLDADNDQEEDTQRYDDGYKAGSEAAYDELIPELRLLVDLILADSRNSSQARDSYDPILREAHRINLEYLDKFQALDPKTESVNIKFRTRKLLESKRAYRS
jgi:hypothetical protein